MRFNVVCLYAPNRNPERIAFFRIMCWEWSIRFRRPFSVGLSIRFLIVEWIGWDRMLWTLHMIAPRLGLAFFMSVVLFMCGAVCTRQIGLQLGQAQWFCCLPGRFDRGARPLASSDELLRDLSMLLFCSMRCYLVSDRTPSLVSWSRHLEVKISRFWRRTSLWL